MLPSIGVFFCLSGAQQLLTEVSLLSRYESQKAREISQGKMVTFLVDQSNVNAQNVDYSHDVAEDPVTGESVISTPA